MGISGKYDFQGIKKAGAAGLKIALANTGWGAFIMKSPFSGAFSAVLELFANYLANQGLVLLNLGAILVNGAIDQHAFDQALADGLAKVELGRDKITPEQGKAIDDAVRNAARKFIHFNPKP